MSAELRTLKDAVKMPFTLNPSHIVK